MKIRIFCDHEVYRPRPDSIEGIGFTLCGFPKGESNPARAYERQAIFVHAKMTKEEFVASLRALADSFETGQGLVTDPWEPLAGQEINREICGEEVCEEVTAAREKWSKLYSERPSS